MSALSFEEIDYISRLTGYPAAWGLDAMVIRPARVTVRERSVPREHHAVIAARVMRGELMERIGAEYGVTRERIRQIAVRSGVTGRHALSARRLERHTRGAARRAAREEEKRLAAVQRARPFVEARATGMSYESVAARLGVSTTYAWHVLRDAAHMPEFAALLKGIRRGRRAAGGEAAG